MMMKDPMLAGLRSNICSNLMANQAEQFNKSINVAYNNNESFIFRQPSISNQLIKVFLAQTQKHCCCILCNKVKLGCHTNATIMFDTSLYPLYLCLLNVFNFMVTALSTSNVTKPEIQPPFQGNKWSTNNAVSQD